MSGGFTFEDEFEKFVDRKTEELVTHYVRKLRKDIVGQIQGVTSRFKRHMGIQPVLDVHVNMHDRGVEVYVHAYFDPETISKIREVLRREYMKSMEDTRTRLRALKHILAYELSSHTGGVSALLSGVHPGPGEGVDKTGGGGAEVRSQERGSAAEGS